MIIPVKVMEADIQDYEFELTLGSDIKTNCEMIFYLPKEYP